jgi:hypothetical protein
MPSSTRILFGECTAGSGDGDRESLLLEVASAAANVEWSNEVQVVATGLPLGPV